MKIKDEELKGRSASPLPSMDDFDLPDFDEDEEVTGEELLEQLPKSPKSQPVTKEEEVRKIEIIAKRV